MESMEDSGSDTEPTFASEFHARLTKIKTLFTKELDVLQTEFTKAVEDLKADMRALKEEQNAVKGTCANLEKRIEALEANDKLHLSQINKQERFARRNNVRIVGVKTVEQEDCLDVSRKIFAEVGIPDCKLERAHRDGKAVAERERHILVKMSFYQDKVFIMKNARRTLADKGYYIIDDLTATDLKEKRRWSTKVQALYSSGTKLRFTAGCWRASDGKPFKFEG